MVVAVSESLACKLGLHVGVLLLGYLEFVQSMSLFVLDAVSISVFFGLVKVTEEGPLFYTAQSLLRAVTQPVRDFLVSLRFNMLLRLYITVVSLI